MWDFCTFGLLHTLPAASQDASEGISSISIGANGKLIIADGQRSVLELSIMAKFIYYHLLLSTI